MDFHGAGVGEGFIRLRRINPLPRAGLPPSPTAAAKAMAVKRLRRDKGRPSPDGPLREGTILSHALNASERETMVYFGIVGESEPDRTPTKDTDADIIEPAEVRWDESPPPKSLVQGRHLPKICMLLLLLAALVAAGVVLVQYLSKNPVHVSMVPDKGVESGGVEERRPAVQGVAEMGEPAQPLLLKAEAEKKLSLYVILKNELDAKGAAEWGGDPYASMMKLGQEADALLVKEQYGAASDQYAMALGKARELADACETVLGELIEEGHLALRQGKGDTAQGRFRLALMIDPGNQTAQRGLAQAEKMESLTRLMEAGRRHEEEGNLAFALADYQEAVRLDPESSDAQKAFDRIKAHIADDQFQQLMSSGFTLFHNGDYEQARAAFLRAKAFKSDSGEIQDALEQVDQAIQLAEMGKLEAGAMAAEAAEDWEKALANYMAALELDPKVQFAAQGKQRSLEQLRIRKHLRFYLDRPKLLESEGHLEKARQLLEDIGFVEPKGAGLSAQAEELRRLVEVAQTPVKVILNSDNLTEVAVYGVGRLGRFETLDLELRPGTYTVVGTREGYKDVRETIVVKAGEGSMQATIRCRDKI